MRVPPGPTSERRPRSRFRVRGWLIAGVVGLIILLLSLRGLAGFYTDFLWFDSIGHGDTWRGLLGARVIPAVIFILIFFVIMLVNLVIADRLAPKYRSMGPEDELVERYQQTVARFRGRIRVGVSLFFALVAGVGVASQWRQWILFTNRVDFGVEDPEFGMDVGFYVFQLPFLRFVTDWLFAGLVIVLLVTAVAHYLNGGIRFQSPFQRVTPQVKAHLSVILAIMALVKTAQYYLGQYELNFSSRGVVEGASYTDVNAQLPALRMLMFISVAAAALFIWNIWRRGWILPIIAVGLWGFVSIVIGTIYPAGVQRFSVSPNEFQSEARYIGRNIEATRNAFDLANVEMTEFDYQESIDPEVVNENRATIDNARLWDPDVTQATYQTLQGFTTFYRIDDVDVDRYEFPDGVTRQVVLSAREINRDELPSQSWVNRHLVYTHGYGIVAAPTNVATSDGDPDFAVGGIPLPENSPIGVEQPELYFGENLPGYALVGAKQAEFDYPREGRSDRRTRYSGADGVDLSNIVRRAAFALRFADINPLISGQITGDTKILLERDIRDRVDKLAPFLEFDADPYPVALEGEIRWVLDGYTTTDRYPYAESASGSGGLDHEFNYIRNSVKATIDAYDGTVTFYVIDDEDPLIRSYQKAFPDLFTDGDEMPRELREHLRYPEDMFRVQSDVFSRYHVTEDRRFYQGNANWLLSPDPGSGTLEEAQLVTEDTGADEATTDEPQDATSTGRRMDPYYLYITLPGDSEPSFVIVQPFVPVSAGDRQTRLVSFMVARSDPGSYGDMTAYEMPQGEVVRGPVQINNEIASTAEIAEQFTLLDQRGSQVISGSLQLIPVGDSILYIRPIYVRGSGASGFPQFQFVVVVTAGQPPVLATSIDQGLGVLFGDLPRPDLGEDPAGPDDEEPEEPADDEPLPEGVQALLDRAAERFNQAQDALDAGDLGRYQELIDEVGELIEEARQAQAGGAPDTTTTTAVAQQT